MKVKDKNVKRFKSDNGIVGKLLLSLDYFKGIKQVDMSAGKE